MTPLLYLFVAFGIFLVGMSIAAIFALLNNKNSNDIEAYLGDIGDSVPVVFFVACFWPLLLPLAAMALLPAVIVFVVWLFRKEKRKYRRMSAGDLNEYVGEEMTITRAGDAILMEYGSVLDKQHKTFVASCTLPDALSEEPEMSIAADTFCTDIARKLVSVTSYVQGAYRVYELHFDRYTGAVINLWAKDTDPEYLELQELR